MEKRKFDPENARALTRAPPSSIQHLPCCYFIISAGMTPCLISRSLVAMARETSTTNIPTSRGVKSSLVEGVNKHFTVGCWGCHVCGGVQLTP